MKPLLWVVALFVNTLLMPLIVEMIKERAPGRAMRLVGFSVQLLPPAYRDRYFAEWTAELDEMDRQNISQLVASIRILLGAPAVARVLRAKDRHRALAERLAYLTSERRVIRIRRHWASLLHALLETFGVVIVTFLLSQLVGGTADDSWVLQPVLWYLAVAAVLRLVYKALEWWVELIIVTDKRFIRSTGVVVRKISMMPITKVTDLSFLRTMGGQTLGYGTLRVESAGQQGQDSLRIDYVPYAEVVFDAISEMIFDEKG